MFTIPSTNKHLSIPEKVQKTPVVTAEYLQYKLHEHFQMSDCLIYIQHSEVIAYSQRASIPVVRLHNINYSNFSFIQESSMDEIQHSVAQ
jgi:hypothetical protein